VEREWAHKSFLLRVFDFIFLLSLLTLLVLEGSSSSTVGVFVDAYTRLSLLICCHSLRFNILSWEAVFALFIVTIDRDGEGVKTVALLY
jgi:hypothetical protein